MPAIEPLLALVVHECGTKRFGHPEVFAKHVDPLYIDRAVVWIDHLHGPLRLPEEERVADAVLTVEEQLIRRGNPIAGLGTKTGNFDHRSHSMIAGASFRPSS